MSLCKRDAVIQRPCLAQSVLDRAWCSRQIEHRRSCTHRAGLFVITCNSAFGLAVQKRLGGVQNAATKAAILTQHNSLRNEYGAGQLTWSVRVAHAAQVRPCANPTGSLVLHAHHLTLPMHKYVCSDSRQHLKSTPEAHVSSCQASLCIIALVLDMPHSLSDLCHTAAEKRQPLPAQP
jgi:hypothetical protein